MTQTQLLLNASNLLIKYLREEFRKQGHSLTQEWEDSVVAQELSDGEIEILALGYGFIVNWGIEPERIPYGGTGSGGDGAISQYILGLARFWKLRKPNISDKQALKLAFATANVQAQEGMSTEASKAYSTTGKRQYFLSAIDTYLSDFLDDWIFTGLDVVIDAAAKEPKIMYL